MTQPIIVGFENAGSVAIRNLFAEITMTASDKSMILSDSAPFSGWSTYLYQQIQYRLPDDGGKAIRAILAEYESEGFRELDGEWRLTMTWDAIQPQRFQLAKPTLYLSTYIPGKLMLNAKLYSDSFATPYEFNAEVDVAVEKRPAKLEDMIPDWQDQIRSEVSNELGPILRVPPTRGKT